YYNVIKVIPLSYACTSIPQLLQDDEYLSVERCQRANMRN
ncbi:29468_t:CDS:1, partial [Racocetra persica]